MSARTEQTAPCVEQPVADYVVAAALLAPCTALAADPPVAKVEWVRVDTQAELDHICGRSVIGRVSGCYKRHSFTDVCTVYTRAMKSETDRAGMEVLGHETRHCFEGNFHNSMDY